MALGDGLGLGDPLRACLSCPSPWASYPEPPLYTRYVGPRPGNNTIIGLSFRLNRDLRHGEYTSMAMELIGASGIAVYTGLPDVELFGLLVALHTAQSLQ